MLSHPVPQAAAAAALIAAMAVASYAVARMQLMESLDRSLLDRASKAATYSALSEVSREDLPSWLVDTAGVRLIVINAFASKPLRLALTLPLSWPRATSACTRSAWLARMVPRVRCSSATSQARMPDSPGFSGKMLSH